MTHTCTSLLLNNRVPPEDLRLQILWELDKDGHGWTGHCKTYLNSEKEIGKEHTVLIRQHTPLGQISVILDGCNGGAWMDYTFGGTSITERDLQWATVFAAAGIKHKECYFEPCKTCKGTGEYSGWDCGPGEGDGRVCETCHGKGKI